jgi:mannonate dehydratase
MSTTSEQKRYPLRAVPGYFGTHPGIQIGATTTPLAEDEELLVFQQLGVEWAMLKVPDESLHSVDNYKRWKERFARYDMQIYRIGSQWHNMAEVTLGLEDCDRKTDDYITHIRNLSAAGIYYTTYAHMATGIWTSGTATGRGGIQARTLDLDVARGQWDDKVLKGEVPDNREFTENELWDNYERFMRKVVPVAEEEGVYIGMHPDDPPVYTLGGVPRCILGNFAGYQRALEIADSPNIGVCLCVGCWLEGGAEGMGVDVLEAIRTFGQQGKIFKVHFRNVTNPMPEPWRETMMDEGYMDMTKVMAALQEVEYDGCVIPDHIPQMSSPKCGENGGTQAGLGFSIGYLRAIANANLRMPIAD